MDVDVFSCQIETRFRYLIEAHGFAVSDRRYFADAMGNCEVVLRSEKVGILVGLDRDQVTLDLGPAFKPERAWYSLVHLLKYLGVEGPDAEYEFPEAWDNYDAMIDCQVARLAQLVRVHCADVVSGKLAIWEELGSQAFDQVLADYRRIVGRDPIVIQDQRLSERIRQEEARRASDSNRRNTEK